MSNRLIHRVIRAALLVASLGMAARHADAAVWYVDPDSTGPIHNGSSWCSAFQKLEDGLAAASPGDTVRVANGTYIPPVGTLADPREASFHFPNGVTVVGAFFGCGAPNPDAQDMSNATSYISGGPLLGTGLPDDYAYHVTRATGVATQLEMLYIDAGRADNELGVDTNIGGGMLAINSSVTLAACIFQGNEATSAYDTGHGYGGALYARNCKVFSKGTLFRESIAGDVGGGVYLEGSYAYLSGTTFAGCISNRYVGGVFADDASELWLNGCDFIACHAGNWSNPGGGGDFGTKGGIINARHCAFTGSAEGPGGAGLLIGGSTTLVNCKFNWCFSSDSGGALVVYGGSVSLVNNLIHDCFARVHGGAIYAESAKVHLGNCTVVGNHADVGSGGVHLSLFAAGDIANSILWKNSSDTLTGESAQFVFNLFSSMSINYSDVTDLVSVLGVGNINASPSFTFDFHLQPGSPCINTGSNPFIAPDTLDLDGDGNTIESTPYDLDNLNRIIGRRVDMGAYEFQ